MNTEFWRQQISGAMTFVAAMTLSVIPYACITVASGDLAAGPLSNTPSPTAASIGALTRQTCGATWSSANGNRSGSDVYVVSAYPEAGRAQQFNHFPSPGEIERFLIANKALLADPRNNAGTYCAYDHGDCHKGDGALNCYVDISRTTTTLAAAAKLARACNQKSIAFLGKAGVEIIDRYDGQPFGDGRDIEGDAMKQCVAAREDL